MWADESWTRTVVVFAEEGSPEVLRTLTLGQLREAAAHVAMCIRAASLAPGVEP